MNVVCENISSSMPMLFDCSTHGEFTRVRTPFLYPDGDYIDLFIKNDNGSITITDLGETIRWLKSQSLSTKRSPKQRKLIADVCLNHGVEFFKGMLLFRIHDMNTLAAGVMRLSQAALRVSDLWFTFRTKAVESFTDEVEDFLLEKNVIFDRSEKIPGRSGKIWQPDFHVRRPEKTSLIFALSTGSKTAARSLTEHVFTSWYDLSHLKIGPSRMGFISLIDDTIDVWREEDFKLLNEVSEVATWSRPEEFYEKLAA